MAAAKSNARWVRVAIDYGAPIIFAAAFFTTRDLILATGVLVAASAAALVLGFVVERRVAPLPLITGVVALGFGAATLIFKDPSFVKMKVTVVNLLFAAGLIGGQALGKNPLKLLLGESLTLPDQAWRTLTIRYGLYFVAVAAANEAIWRTQPDGTWVGFRIALLPLALVFSLTQAPFLMKHMKQAEEPTAPEPPDAGF